MEATDMNRYDIAIIGTGPAGLEAAITAKVRNKNILLLGGGALSTKVEKAHKIQNYLGLPDVSGEEMQAAFRRHLEQMNIAITEDRVNMVFAAGSYFAIQGHQEIYEADTVILACGMSVARPFPGELEYLGRGVSYCATCDGALYRGKSTVVIGYSQSDEQEAAFLAELAAEVIYIPMYPEVGSLDDRIHVMSNVTPVGIDRGEHGLVLRLEDRDLEANGIFILRDQVAPAQLVPGLVMEQDHIAVNRSMETNIPGLFACGDITGAPYQYIKAAGEGNVAALSAVHYLSQIAR